MSFNRRLIFWWRKHIHPSRQGREAAAVDPPVIAQLLKTAQRWESKAGGIQAQEANPCVLEPDFLVFRLTVCNTKSVSWVNEVKNLFARTDLGKPLTAYFVGTQEYKELKLSPHLAVARRKSLLQPSHVAQSPYRCSPPCAQLLPPWHKLCPHHDSHCVLPAQDPDLAGNSSVETRAFPFYLGRDRDALECGSISLSMPQYLAGPRDGEATYAKGKAGYKEGGK